MRGQGEGEGVDLSDPIPALMLYSPQDRTDTTSVMTGASIIDLLAEGFQSVWKQRVS